MKGNQMGYHLREGFRSIFSHGLMSFAAVCTIIGCLLIMGSFSLVAVNVDNMLARLEADNEFLAFIDDELTLDDAQAIEQKLKQIENISEVVFVTREEAMDSFVEDKEQSLFKDLPSEVLRHRYQVKVVDIELMSDTVQEVENITGIAKVRADLEIAEGFIFVRNIAMVLAIILIVMLVVISLFIIANTVRIATFTRREEIAIMKMCGATDWFIRWPFVFEGVIIGLFGAILAFFMQWGIYEVLHTAITNVANLSFVEIVPFINVAQSVLLYFLVLGFVIGASGSGLAIRKFLRV